MIRIVHFVSTLDIRSGVMSVIMNYYRNIDKNKYQFAFLYFMDSESNYIEEIKNLGGKVYKITKPTFSLKWIKQLRQFFIENDFQYTIFHNHEVYLTLILKFVLMDMKIERFIVHAHATKYSDKFLNSIRNFLLCLPIRFISCEKVACSKAAAQFLYGTLSNIYILNNAIEIEKYRYNDELRNELRKKYNIDKDTLVIGHIGRMVPQKNDFFLLEILKNVLEKQECILFFIGDGILRNQILEFVEKNHLKEHIIFLKKSSNINSLLNLMDIFVLPSLYEGLPVVCIEAQSNGLPIVISDTITDEVILTPLCQKLSLNDSVNVWGNKLLELYKNSYKNEREKIIDYIYDSSFNIKKEIIEIEKYYSMRKNYEKIH